MSFLSVNKYYSHTHFICFPGPTWVRIMRDVICSPTHLEALDWGRLSYTDTDCLITHCI